MGARISLRHLRCFVAVAETGSFTLAAGRLFQTQSSLTATIKQLEEAAGLRLFDRTTRRVELTSNAVWFKSVAENILREFDNAVADLQAVSKSRSGLIRIAAASSMVTHVLTPTLATFRQAYPDVTIRVLDAGADRIERAVLEGSVDFGICSRLNGFPDLDYTPVLSDPFGALFPADHPLAQRSGPLTWRDLEGFDYVGLTGDTGIGAALSSYVSLGMKWHDDRFDQASSTTSLYALLKLGGRFSVLPALAARTGPLGEFEYRELAHPAIALEICLITRHMRSHSPNAQRVLATLKQTIREASYLYGAKAL